MHACMYVCMYVCMYLKLGGSAFSSSQWFWGFLVFAAEARAARIE